MEQAFSFAAIELTAAGFTAAAILFALRGQYSLPKTLYSIALGITGLWAFFSGLSQWGYTGDILPSIFSALRDAAWFGATLALLQEESEGQSLWRRLGLAAGI